MYNKITGKLTIISTLVISIIMLSSSVIGRVNSVNSPSTSDGFVTSNKTVVKGVSRISTPFQDQGYANFETTVITSQSELDQFITSVKEQNDWDNKIDFLNNILLVDYDFTKNNLLLYRITESSDSAILTPKNSVVRDDKVTIHLDHQITSPRDRQANHAPVYRTLGTTGIVNYLFAYKIVKTEKELIVKNGSEETTVALTSDKKTHTHLSFNSEKLLDWSAL